MAAEFQTFDLGRVIQAAEAIKGMRRQSITDRLQQQYLGDKIQQGQREQKREEIKFTDDQRVANTEWMVGASEQVLALPEDQQPAAYESMFDEVKRRGIIPADTPRQAYDPTTFRQGTANAKVMLGRIRAPQSAQGKITADVREGFLTEGQATTALAPKQSRLPSSYEEHILAQTDPEFAKFLRNRKGRGLSVTLPDGTVVEMGGEGGKVGPGELSKPTVNSLQETIVNSSNRLDRINQLMTAYKPEFLQAKGLLKAGTTELKDFLGMDVKEEDRKFLSSYGEFQSTSSQEFSATLKELSGTAASESEVARVIKGVPSDRDKSPTVFEAKARATTKFITRAIMRANWALKNGIGIESVDQLSKRMPLEGIDAVYEARASQIWQEMGGTPESKAKAIEQANQEFGLAR